MTDTQKIHQFAEKNLLVERYLLKELQGADLEDFEQHLFECSLCFDQVKAGMALAKTIATDPPQGTRQRMQWWRLMKAWWNK